MKIRWEAQDFAVSPVFFARSASFVFFFSEKTKKIHILYKMPITYFEKIWYNVDSKTMTRREKRRI